MRVFGPVTGGTLFIAPDVGAPWFKPWSNPLREGVGLRAARQRRLTKCVGRSGG